MNKEHAFKLPIGDWSDDGHGKCEWFHFKSNKPIEAVREAYFKAKKEMAWACPDRICNQYEERSIGPLLLNKLIDQFPSLKPWKEMNCDWVETQFIVDLVVEFLKYGDPELKISQLFDDLVPSLTFYGFDKKKRHIPGFGYGLFE